MKHQTIDGIRSIGALRSDMVSASKRERLERWAQLLERNPESHFSTLQETEYQAPVDRDLMRHPNSPIAVAYADSYFRALGMKDDTYGEAKLFFGLSDRRLHDVLCYCHHGNSVTARRAAQAVRGAIAAESRRAFWSNLMGRLHVPQLRGA